MTYKAMRLDAAGILLEVVELEDEYELPPRHVDLRPYGGDTDTPPLEYRWDAARETLLPLAPHERPRAAQGRRVSLDAAYYADLLARQAAGAAFPADVLAWMTAYAASIDGQQRG